MTIRQWSTTPSLNSNVAGINFSENQNPSTVNNSAREMMAQLRSEYTPDRWGWVACSATASKNSLTVFKLTGDRTADYIANRRVKLTGGSTTVYATIVSSSYTSETTITITNSSSDLSNSHTVAWVSTIYDQNLPGNVVTTSGTSTFTSEAVFLATASFGSAVKISGTLSVGGDIVALGDLTVAGSATLSGTVTMLSALNVSGTANVGTLLVGGAPVVTGGGWSVIGSTAIAAAQTSEVKFSGSWSVYTSFKIFVNIDGTSATSGSIARLNIYTDGGTTSILSIANGSFTGTSYSCDYEVHGSGATRKIIKHHGGTSVAYGQTITSNSGIINCIGFQTSGVTISLATIVILACRG